MQGRCLLFLVIETHCTEVMCWTWSESLPLLFCGKESVVSTLRTAGDGHVIPLSPAEKSLPLRGPCPIGGGAPCGLAAAGEGLAPNALGLVTALLSVRNGAARACV